MRVSNSVVMKSILASLVIVLLSAGNSSAIAETGKDPERKYYIGTSAFMIGNLFPDPPYFFQLDYGFHLTQKDVLIIEGITWTYLAPLGMPVTSAKVPKDKSYPGSVRAFGVGLDYQRFYWKGLYSTVHATPFLQYFMNPDNEVIQTGFQLFLQFRIGYHFKLFHNRFYIEPSVAFNYWPINTNLPVSFQQKEDKWPNYALFEPGLNFGFKF
jgi:hypothetical protein